MSFLIFGNNPTPLDQGIVDSKCSFFNRNRHRSRKQSKRQMLSWFCPLRLPGLQVQCTTWDSSGSSHSSRWSGSVFSCDSNPWKLRTFPEHWREVLILTLPILNTPEGCISWYIPRDGLMIREWPYTARSRDISGRTSPSTSRFPLALEKYLGRQGCTIHISKRILKVHFSTPPLRHSCRALNDLLYTKLAFFTDNVQTGLIMDRAQTDN